jgi:hypothetical protein
MGLFRAIPPEQVHSRRNPTHGLHPFQFSLQNVMHLQISYAKEKKQFLIMNFIGFMG